jgi:hypothetical protein
MHLLWRDVAKESATQQPYQSYLQLAEVDEMFPSFMLQDSTIMKTGNLSCIIKFTGKKAA